MSPRRAALVNRLAAHRRALAVLVMVAVTVPAVAVGMSLATGQDGFLPITFARSSNESSIASAVPQNTPDDVLKALVARLKSTAIVDARFERVAASAERAGGIVLQENVKADGPGASGIRATWEAELLAGAVRDVLSGKGLGSLDNFLVIEQFPDASSIPTDSGFGNVTRGQLFDTASPTELETRIRELLRESGLRAVSVGTARAVQASPVVIAISNDPRRTVDQATRPEFWTKVLGDYDNYEGYYLELRDNAGNPFLISTVAHRAGSSSSWTRGDLRTRGGRITNPVPVEGSG